VPVHRWHPAEAASSAASSASCQYRVEDVRLRQSWRHRRNRWVSSL